MNIEIPKQQCWVPPEGNYPATCLDAGPIQRRNEGNWEDWLRLIFEVHVDDDRNVQYLAQKKYRLPLMPGHDLLQDLIGWLGRDFLEKKSKLDPSTLKGKDADLQLVHITNERYEKPFVYIRSIHSQGSLLSADEPAVIRAPFLKLNLDALG